MPVRTYEKKGYAVQTYDLSLASGRTKFLAEVMVTIPWGEKDGEEVMFLTKDPETGKNEEEYFEISEDGRSYMLYTTHFSNHSKVIISDFGKNFSEAVRTGDITGKETREALSAFYYPTRVPWNERMTAPVRFSLLPAFTDKKGNVVFRCTLFHYLMMGAPTAIEGRDLSGLSPEERAKAIKKNLFGSSYSDITITADPDGYVIDRDVRGGDPVNQGAPHSEYRLPGAGGTKEELVSAIRSTGTQVRYKVLPSDEKPSFSLDNIPVPKAGGNRRLCIDYSSVVLVYREAGGARNSERRRLRF